MKFNLICIISCTKIKKSFKQPEIWTLSFSGFFANLKILFFFPNQFSSTARPVHRIVRPMLGGVCDASATKLKRN